MADKQPCNALNIEYKAQVRTYPNGERILFLFATCWYQSFGEMTEVSFESQEGTWTRWQLVQQVPEPQPELTSYHVACGTTRVAIPTEPIPSSVVVTDAYGEHEVSVESW